MLSRSVRSKRMDKPMSAIVGHACAKRHINYHKGIKMPKGTGFGTAAPTFGQADDSGRGPNQMHPENGRSTREPPAARRRHIMEDHANNQVWRGKCLPASRHTSIF